MRIQKLTTADELFESEHVLATAFLHPWDENEAREKAKAQAAGTAPVSEESWGIFDDADKLVCSISTLRHQLAFGGQVMPVGEVHMVGSLPEGRGGGNVRTLMAELLRHFKQRGDQMAVLIPFSFSFYRKFGFELAARTMTQRVPINQLGAFGCDYTVTRVSSEQDVAVLRSLYDDFVASRNLASFRSDAAWAYKGNGEWGERDFFHRDSMRYTYVLWDGAGRAHAYVTFIFVTGDKGPFVGELKVSDLVYDSPEAFRGVLGFLYRLRAKATHVEFELMDDIDLGTLIPDCDQAERTVGGHVMARLLDVPGMLQKMPHPAGSSSYVVEVEDSFMPENDGRYRVSFGAGKATTVEKTEDGADLSVTEETLCQLVVGRIGLDDARYRAGTVIQGSKQVLEQMFVRRPVCLDL